MGGDKNTDELVLGAELYCTYSQGLRTYLWVADHSRKKLGPYEMPMACVKDCIKDLNISPFGGPCYGGEMCDKEQDIMVLADEWENPAGQDEDINGYKIITMQSQLQCKSKGGTIYPSNSGQDGVVGEQLLFITQFDKELLDVLCDPYGSLYSPTDLTGKAFEFLAAVMARQGGEIDLGRFGKSPLGKMWDSVVGSKVNMVDALTIMTINHLTGVDVTNAYRGPLDYPYATSLMGYNGLYGPTSSKLFANQSPIELNGTQVLLPYSTLNSSNERFLNATTLQALRNYSDEIAQEVAKGDGFASQKWAEENKATIAGMKQILGGILILVMAKVGTKSKLGNTIENVGSNAGDSIKFGSDVKSATKLSNQMAQRGWTESTVRSTVSNPYTTRVSTNLATGNAATVYYNNAGAYVIIDDVTNAVVQVSDSVNPLTWVPDVNIIDPYIPNTP